MYAGTKMVITGINANLEKTLTEKIKANQGRIMQKPKKDAFAALGVKRKSDDEGKEKGKWILPEDVTHVIIGETYKGDGPDVVMEKLGLSSIPENVEVVTNAWISECLASKKKVDTEAFKVNMTASPPPPPSALPVIEIDDEDEGVDGGQGSIEGGRSKKRSRLEGSGGQAGGGGAAAAADGRVDRPFLIPIPEDCDVLRAEFPIVPPAGTTPGHHFRKMKGLLHMRVQGASTSSRIAIFDLDGTLIKTDSGAVKPDSPHDWKWLYRNTRTKLRELHSQGYQIIIISNQKWVQQGKITEAELMEKASLLVKSLGLPIEIFFATGDNVFRKPRPGVWYLLTNRQQVDRAQSFFVGDAAGRPKNGTRRKDFSDSDVKFAINAGIPFKTPEEFFLGDTSPYHSGRRATLAVSRLPLEGYCLSSKEAQQQFIKPTTPPSTHEAVLLVGPAAAGKTTFAKTHLPFHTWVNQDTLKTLDRCRTAAKKALQQGQSIVVDATNTTPQIRMEWIDFVKEVVGPSTPIRVRAVDFSAIPQQVVEHLNAFRGSNPYSKDNRNLPYMVLKAILNKVVSITEREGFDEIVKVKGVIPQPFRNTLEEGLFFSHLMEKK